jgi:hypothetical protein
MTRQSARLLKARHVAKSLAIDDGMKIKCEQYSGGH